MKFLTRIFSIFKRKPKPNLNFLPTCTKIDYSLMSFDLVPVVPMSRPSATLMYVDFAYDDGYNILQIRKDKINKIRRKDKIRFIKNKFLKV
jgi:hypothetical protein